MIEIKTQPLLKLPKMSQLALKISETSSYGRFKVGCVLVKRNNILSIGTNSKKTHPLQAKFSSRPHLSNWLHAEVHAISRAVAGDLEGADAYVMRSLRDGSLGNSKPCRGCSRALQHFGVKRVFYCMDNQFFREDL